VSIGNKAFLKYQKTELKFQVVKDHMLEIAVSKFQLEIKVPRTKLENQQIRITLLYP
jgi:hypothetical protein